MLRSSTGNRYAPTYRAMSQLRTRQVLSMAKVFSTVVLSLLLQGSGTIFEIDLWPGEGLPVFEAASRQLLLHDAPSSSSRVTQSVNVNPGQRVAFDDTRYRTIQTAGIRAR